MSNRTQQKQIKKGKKSTKDDRMKRLKRRLVVVRLFFVIPLFFFVYRVGYYKVVWGEEFERRVLERMANTEREIKALRGSVVDRNNKALITSSLVYHIILEPKVILEQLNEKERAHTYETLGQYMGKSAREIEEIVTSNANLWYKILQKDISAEDMETLKKERIKGIWFEESFIRTYPKQELMAQVLGFYNGTEGQYGVEQAYNEKMTGKSGRIFPKVQEGNIGITEVAPSKAGDTLVLTIDEIVQQYVEQVMNRYVVEYEAVNASAIVMNPNNGEVYAMYSYPFYNPNRYTSLEVQMGKDKWEALTGEEQSYALNQAWKNYNIQNPYEAGSTLKPLIMSIAIEEGYVDLGDHFNCTGKSNVAGTTIGCWKTSGHGIQSLEQALANSCNSAMIQIGEKIPTDVFYEYLLKFGLGAPTGIDLPNEAGGLLHPLSRFGPVEKATASMGQGITTTPVQLLSGFSAVINGGYLITPHVVAETTDQKGDIVNQTEVNVRRQVISAATSSTLKRYMRTTVTEGTGGHAAVTGYTIAGKTGTAEKLPRGSGKHIISFVGYAPYENPEVIALILFDEAPEKSGAATRAFNEMMQNILPYLGIETSDQDQLISPTTAVVPSVEGLNLYDAVAALSTQQLGYETIGVGTTVASQFPAAGTKLPLDATVKIYLETSAPEAIISVPDLVGKTVEEASQLCKGFFELSGDSEGLIVQQVPAADTKIEQGSKIIVQTSKE